jgi:opacity protein-like surface antigen
MPRLVVCLVVWGIGLVVPNDASAQSSPTGGFYVTALYGTNRDLFSLTQPFTQGLALAGFRELRIDFEPAADQAVFGVGAAGHVARFVVVSTEFLYSDLGESQVSGRVGFSPRVNFAFHPRLFEWTSGVRAQVPAGSWRVRPYVGAGAGLVRLNLSAEGAGTSLSDHTNDLVYHFDFGAQVFLARTFGVGPEFRTVRLPDGTFYRILIGAIFRFA